MSLLYGMRFLNPTASTTRPHVLGFSVARAADDELFRVDNSDDGTSKVLVVFPNKIASAVTVQPVANNAVDLGTTALRWRGIFGVDGNLSGDLAVAGTVDLDASGGRIVLPVGADQWAT